MLLEVLRFIAGLTVKLGTLVAIGGGMGLFAATTRRGRRLAAVVLAASVVVVMIALVVLMLLFHVADQALGPGG